jgi:uncharacterized protein (UPF0548 family)
MMSFRRLGPTQLEELLAKARLASPNYAEVGASRDAELPSGFHHVRFSERVGDAASFDLAVEGLRTWVAHEGAGLRIYPHEPLTPGATVLAVTTIGPMQVVAPCRIVAVFKEPYSFGFSYGTLPGHPERGEENFALHLRNGATYFTITAFSNAVDPLARLSGPFGRAVQRSVTRRYVKALGRYVAAASAEETPTTDEPTT